MVFWKGVLQAIYGLWLVVREQRDAAGILIFNLLVLTGLGSTWLWLACSHHPPLGLRVIRVFRTTQRYALRLLWVSLEEELGLLFYAKLFVFLSFLHSLASLISNYLCWFPLELHKWPEDSTLLLQTNTEGLLYPTGSCLVSNALPLFGYFSILRKQEVGQERE